MKKTIPEWMTVIEKEQLISLTITLGETLELLDTAAKGILLVVDMRGVLTRTVTDGDLRRLIISGCSMDETLESLPCKDAVTATYEDTVAELLMKMNQNGVNQIPVVDEVGRPIGIAYRHVVDTSILLSTPHLGELEQSFVTQAFDTNWVAPVGPNIDAFETELADKVGVNHAVALSSGTAALHLALRVLNVGVGDTVFCSSFTFVATVNPILYMGAEPVFIDSEDKTWNMSPSALQRALEDAEHEKKLPKAVMVVNLYGQSADYFAISSLCDSYGVPIIEDAAESLGATYRDKSSGTIGRVGVFSFNGNKIITTSGGGALISDDENLTSKAKFLSTQAREPTPWYEHKEVGYNYRMSNVLAGIGRGQLRVLDERVNARRAVFDRYVELLADTPEIDWMPEADFGRSTRWLTTARINMNDINVAEVVATLSRDGIEARQVWKPMHAQPVFANMRYYPHLAERSVSDELFEFGICLPSSSHLTLKQQQRVVVALCSAIGVSAC